MNASASVARLPFIMPAGTPLSLCANKRTPKLGTDTQYLGNHQPNIWQANRKH